jgi:hypothetical protein
VKSCARDVMSPVDDDLLGIKRTYIGLDTSPGWCHAEETDQTAPHHHLPSLLYGSLVFVSLCPLHLFGLSAGPSPIG